MTNKMIIVGGPISAGKSTLVNSLGFPKVPELDPNDSLQRIMLKYTYEKQRVSPEVIELFFLEKRWNIYRHFSKKNKTYILDRSIFESLWFAKENLCEKSYIHFKELWEKEVNELIKRYGKPKLYILLLLNWSNFKERISKRGRTVEINNFEKNKSFFKKHIKEYDEFMTTIFEKFEINYYKIDSNKNNTEEVNKMAMKQVNKYV